MSKRYIVSRTFRKGGKIIDVQYVTHVNGWGCVNGYGKDRAQALHLSKWQRDRVMSEMEFINADFVVEEVAA